MPPAPLAGIRRRTALGLLAALPVTLLPRAILAQEGGEGDLPDDLMTPVAATYARLSSYSDSGTIETSYRWPETPAVTELHRFETAFRAPRNFFFRFDQDPASGGDALVIWCDGGPFQSWWKATGVHDVYDGGRGAVAFFNGESPSKGAATLLAPHVFPQAGLFGATTKLIEPRDGGEDVLEGRPARRIVAGSRVTGVQTIEERPVTLWIDGETGLIIQALVEAETGSPEGLVDSRLFKLHPVADPDLADERFVFQPPEGGQ